MKKVYLTVIVICLSIIQMLGQEIPNGGFKTFTGSVPDGWSSLPTSAYTGSDTTSLRIGQDSLSVFVTAQNTSGTVERGVLVTGSATVGSSTYIGGGFIPISSRPKSLSGIAKYTTSAGNKGGVSVTLSKWNGFTRDTIGGVIGTYFEITNADTMKGFNVPITYLPGYDGVTPDSVQVSGISSISTAIPNLADTLWIDQLRFLSCLPDTSLNLVQNGGVYFFPESDIYMIDNADSRVYEQTFSLVAPDPANFNFQGIDIAVEELDSIRIDDISNLPAGVTMECAHPSCIVYGNTIGCYTVSGTLPNDNDAYYKSQFYTTMYGYSSTFGAFLGDPILQNMGSTNNDSITFVIGDPVLMLQENAIDISAGGICDGSASVGIIQGVPPFSYEWSTGATTSNLLDLCAGNYMVVVTGGNGVKDSVECVVEESSSCPSCSVSITDTLFAQTNVSYVDTVLLDYDTTGFASDPAVVSFGGRMDSIILVEVKGLPDGITWVSTCGSELMCKANLIGNTPLVFRGTPTTASSKLILVISNSYTQILGSPDILIDTTFYLLNVGLTSLQISTPTTNVSSSGLCDGSASVSVVGGTAPYSYQWNSGETTQTLSSKCSDKYTVIVTDAGGIVDSANAYISEPTQTISNVPAGTSAPDTIINNLDTCIINYDLAIDSAFIRTFTITDSSHIIFDYEIYQGGVKSEFSIEFEYDSVGQTLIVLNLNCTGAFTRMLQTTIIESVVDVQYSEIGVTQTVGNLNATGINSNDKLEMLQVYPNPFEDYLTMNVATSSTIQISDATGRLVYSGVLNSGVNTVNTAAFGAGVYLIAVTNDEGVVTRKVMKK